MPKIFQRPSFTEKFVFNSINTILLQSPKDNKMITENYSKE